jgi:cell division protein FtsL
VSVRTTSAGVQAVEGPRPKLTRRAGVLLVAVAALTLFSMAPVRAYLNQRAEIAELERQVQQLDDSNAKLRAEISRLHDPAELERRARECLGMVRPGEVALVIGPKGGRPASARC